jgi:hypothetical protein
MGRPSDYNDDIAADICSKLAEGQSLRTVCLPEDMPSKTSVFRWLAANSEFRDQYARAKVESADAMAEDMLGIADEIEDKIVGDDRSDGARVQAQKVRIDTRKWLASKMQPKKYGDRIEVVPPGSEALSPEAEAILSRVLSGEYTASPTAD